MMGDLAKLLGVRNCGGMSVSAGVSESQVFGWLMPMGEGRWLGTPFTDAYENGGMYVFDEADAADPNMRLALNMALENGRVYIAARAASGLDPMILRHKDAHLVLGMNTFDGMGGGSAFTGRAVQDAAGTDRLFMVPVDYDLAYEARLVGLPAPANALPMWTPSAPLTPGEAPHWMTWVQAVRASLQARKSKRFFTTRALKKALAARSVGLTKAEVVASLFGGWSETELAALGDLAGGPAGA
jgi:hypothetical protein